MLRTLCRSVVVIGCLLVPARPATAQAIELASRGPRFLSVSSHLEKPVDVRQVPVLLRRVTLNLTSVTLNAALHALSAQAGLELAYSRAVAPVDRVVSLHAEGLTVVAALTELLVDADVDVAVASAGRMVLVRRGPASDERQRLAQTGTVVGRVTDKKTGSALAGATVVVDGTSRSTTTGTDGRYRIPAVAPGTYTARARYIGYAPASASVTVSADQEATADFTLEKSAQRLDEVVTTGTIVETQEKALPSPITVITGDEIREKHVQHVDQLFRGDVPGILAWDTGNLDDQANINVRGGSSLNGVGTIKTYVDGVELAEGSLYLSTIDPNSIDRIELIRGPQASTIYGAEALNGVLQIFTKKGTAQARPIIQGGMAGGAIQTKWASQHAVPTYVGNASISGGTGAFAYSLGGSRSYKGEWIPQYRNTENMLSGSLSGTQGWLSLELSGRLDFQNRGNAIGAFIATYLPPAPPTDLNYQETAIAVTAKAQASRLWQHTLTVGADRLLQEFVQRTPAPGDSLVPISSLEEQKVSLTYTTTLQGALSHALAASLTAGANVSAYKEADFSGSAAKTYGALSVLSSANRVVRGNRGYFGQAQLSISDALFLTAGLRAESDDNFGQDYGLAWSPRVGASYVRPLGNVTVKVRASYGRSIRPPGVFARDGLTSPETVYLPNPQIEPEAQHGIDAGIDLYAGNWGTLQATYYNQTADGLIDQVLIAPGVVPAYQFQNVGAIRNKGLELQESLSLLRNVTLSGTYTIMSSRVKQVSPAYAGDLQVGDQLLAIPQHAIGGTLSYSGAGWTTTLGILHSGSWTNTDFYALFDSFFKGAPYRGSGRAYWTQYPAFTKLHATMARRFSAGVSAFVNVDNLANSYAYENANFLFPSGRVTTAGLNFRF